MNGGAMVGYRLQELLVIPFEVVELQRRELRALGCTMAQGYLFSKPVAADVFTRLIMGNVG